MLEHNKYLGIYIAPDKTTVVLAAKTANKVEVFGHFAVMHQQPPQAEGQPAPKFSFSDAAGQIASLCTERNFAYAYAAVAIDCRLYRQQKLHSEFQDQRQIAQTIRFDAEEALAIDAAQTAVAFEILSRQISGSDVSIFAASAELITEIIKSLQAHKLDPVVIEPDSICLRRIIDDLAKGSIAVAVSPAKCFMICPAGSDGKAVVRSFLTSPAQNKTSLFAGQIMLTMSALSAEGRASDIKVFDTTNNLDIHMLAEQTSMPVELLNMSERIVLPEAENNDGQSLDLIIAAGAAAALVPRTEKVDFRSDFMPYEGRKAAIEKTVKILSIGALIILAVIGTVLQMHYYSKAKDIKKLNDKFKSEYVIAMPGARFPASTKEAVRKLKSEINKIKDVKSGLLSASGEDSIEARLTFLFEALNGVPQNVDIDIDKISVTTKTMNITGSTNLGGHLQLFSAFDKHPKLARGSSTFEPKEGRDNFRLTIELKQGAKE